jgi:transglutaminase superfamily protein
MRMLAAAFVTVARVRISLWLLPWRGFAKSMTIAHNVTPLPPTPERLEWSVKMASRAVPYATCLTQALALHRLLARHGHCSVIQVGVRNVDGRFLAHAWVEHEGRMFLGTSENIACYSRFFTWPAPQLDRQ